MKKRIIACILCVFTIFSLCGCKMSMDITFNKDGSAEMTNCILIEKELLTEMEMDDAQLKQSGYKLVTVDGVKYYENKSTIQLTKEEVAADDSNMTPEYCYFGAEDATEAMTPEEMNPKDLGMSDEDWKKLQDSVQYNMSITYPYKITKTNGTLSNDNMTVTWDLLKVKDSCYAYTTKYSDEKAPVIKGVKDGSTYEKAVTVKFKDDSAIKSSKLDGKNFKSGKKVSKKGEHTVEVADVFGNKSTVKFVIK